MKRIFNIITLLTVLFVTSCVKDENVIKEANYDFKTNYEAFWNLFNEKYKAFYFESLQHPFFSLGKPRQIGITLHYNL